MTFSVTRASGSLVIVPFDRARAHNDMLIIIRCTGASSKKLSGTDGSSELKGQERALRLLEREQQAPLPTS